MKRFILYAVLSVCALSVFAQVDLQSGDLLFQAGKNTRLSDAIAEVTSGEGNISYTHVGIVSVENGKVFVIEATTPNVRKVVIDTFLNAGLKIDGKPIVAAGRLKSRHRDIIPQAIKNAETYLGKPYDYVYSPDNDEYYCSELVYISFKTKKGKPVFKSKKMTFCDENGKMTDAWIEHFAKYKTPIPEGRQGTNPGDMSKSKEIDIIYKYFE